MKILLVNDYGTPTGGAELMMLALREGLRQRGYDARFFASCAKGGAAESLADSECFGTTSSLRTLLQTANPLALVKLSHILKTFQPDIVHVRIFLTQLSPLILPLLKDIPALYHVAWYRAICPLGTKMLPDGTSCSDRAGAVCYTKGCLPFRDWLPLMLQMKLWRHWRDAFNLIVANSEATKRRLVAEGIEPVEVVWNGIPIRPQRPPLSSPPTVAFAGRLVWEKGADVLVRAFAKVAAEIPQARLLVAGDGPERSALASLISEHKLQQNVTLLGHLSREEMELHFASAWVQAVPSRWQEPFGIVAAEAMMRGTAVVASGSGGLTEIVRESHTGFLIPPEDAGALTEALLRLLQNRNLAEQMGQTAREVALKDFSEASFVNRFIQLYSKLLQNRG